jgi:hypothetical protein
MKCNATSKSTNKPCQKSAIRGGTVCRSHGGAAPQVRNKAAARLAGAVDSAVENLLRKQESIIESVSLRATQDILDRMNYKGDNLIRLANPDAGGVHQVSLTEEQIARVERLAPDELAIFLRVLGLIAEPSAIEAPREPRLNP